MLGAIAGDIVGSVYEHNQIKTTSFPLFSVGSRFTDDSVLTVAVADCLLHQGSYAKKFEDYYYLYPRAGYGNSFQDWASSHHHQPYNSWGNGSAMRVSPIGWVFSDLEQTLAEAKKSAEVTHNHPEGIKREGLWCHVSTFDILRSHSACGTLGRAAKCRMLRRDPSEGHSGQARMVQEVRAGSTSFEGGKAF